MKIAVIGGGISGVSAAYLLKKHTKYEVILIEKERLIGGKAATFKEDGYTIETGPNGFLDNKEEIKKLINDSGFDDNVIESKEESRKRYIFSKGKLFQLPENPIKLFFSDFFTLKGLAEIFKEPFVEQFMQDETLERFVTRRLGREMLDKLIGPMACGVYAGDPQYMSMDATFKKIKDIERQYGSLIKGLISMMKQKKAKASSASGPFSAKLMSFKDGVGSFVSHLSENIDRLIGEVVNIEKQGKGYRVDTKRDSVYADYVIFATPAYALSRIVEKLDYEFSSVLDIEYAPLSVVSLGFDKKNMPEIVNSFGYLFNLNDIEDTIGVLFDSSIFDFRAPKGKVLVRLMIGGAIKKQSAFKKNIYGVAVKELQRSASIFNAFEYSHLKRHTFAIPQYGLNHKEMINRINEFERKNKGIFITGNAFYGVSLNDCIASSYELISKVL